MFGRGKREQQTDAFGNPIAGGSHVAGSAGAVDNDVQDLETAAFAEARVGTRWEHWTWDEDARLEAIALWEDRDPAGPSIVGLARFVDDEGEERLVLWETDVDVEPGDDPDDLVLAADHEVVRAHPRLVEALPAVLAHDPAVERKPIDLAGGPRHAEVGTLVARRIEGAWPGFMPNEVARVVVLDPYDPNPEDTAKRVARGENPPKALLEGSLVVLVDAHGKILQVTREKIDVADVASPSGGSSPLKALFWIAVVLVILALNFDAC